MPRKQSRKQNHQQKMRCKSKSTKMNPVENAANSSLKLQPETRGPNKYAMQPLNANNGLPRNAKLTAALTTHATRNAMLKIENVNWSNNAVAKKVIRIAWTRKFRHSNKISRTLKRPKKLPVKQNHSLKNVSNLRANESKMRETKACHHWMNQTLLPNWHHDLQSRPRMNWEKLRKLCENSAKEWPAKNN